ncbi:MAG: guanylate kinase [Clostridiales bacterium]|nr:guanylate kinase [Clostridiales bacterium]
MTNERGTLFVVSAPSGSGKGTILSEVFKNSKNVFYSVSATTRKPRPGEVDKVDYFFIDKDKFSNLVESNGMLEYATYCENLYGTPRHEVEKKLNEGFDVILEIETNGAMQVREKMPDATLIFILPPSIKELRRRLKKRGTENDDVINKRVAEAEAEIRQAYSYDYILMNNELSDAINDFTAVLRAAKLENKKTKILIDEVLNDA